jgi:hypothetical protein
MNENLPDELISAYLDDELSAEERARVETMLAESAELRQSLEELRALRANLKSLPRHRLDPLFAERVLREAERQMLASPKGQWPNAAPQGANSSSSVTVQRPPRNWRALAWAGVAASLALVMLINEKLRDNRIEIAQGDRPAPRSEALKSDVARETDRETARSAGKDAPRMEPPAFRAKEHLPPPAAPESEATVTETDAPVEKAALATKQPSIMRKEGNAKSIDDGGRDLVAPGDRPSIVGKGGAGAEGQTQTARAADAPRQQAAFDAPAPETALAETLEGDRPAAVWFVTAAATPEIRREVYKTLSANAIDVDADRERSKSEVDDSSEALEIEATPQQAAAVVAMLRDRGALRTSVRLDSALDRAQFGMPPAPPAPPAAVVEEKAADKAGDARRRTTESATAEDRKSDQAPQPKAKTDEPRPPAPSADRPAPSRATRENEEGLEQSTTQSRRAAPNRGKPGGVAAPRAVNRAERADGQQQRELEPTAPAQTGVQQERGRARRLEVSKTPQLDEIAGVGPPAENAPNRQSFQDRQKSEKKGELDLEKRAAQAPAVANEPQSQQKRVRMVLLLQDK